MCLISRIYLSFGSSALQDVPLGSLLVALWPQVHTRGDERGFKQHSAALALPQMGFFFWVTAAANLGKWDFILVFECWPKRFRHKANTKQGADSQKWGEDESLGPKSNRSGQKWASALTGGGIPAGLVLCRFSWHLCCAPKALEKHFHCSVLLQSLHSHPQLFLCPNCFNQAALSPLTLFWSSHTTEPVAYSELSRGIWCWTVRTSDNSATGSTGEGNVNSGPSLYHFQANWIQFHRALICLLKKYNKKNPNPNQNPLHCEGI